MSAAGEILNHKPRSQLRSGTLNLIETVGQSLAAIAPTLTPALNITGGRGTCRARLLDVVFHRYPRCGHRCRERGRAGVAASRGGVVFRLYRS